MYSTGLICSRDIYNIPWSTTEVGRTSIRCHSAAVYSNRWSMKEQAIKQCSRWAKLGFISGYNPVGISLLSAFPMALLLHQSPYGFLSFCWQCFGRNLSRALNSPGPYRKHEVRGCLLFACCTGQLQRQHICSILSESLYWKENVNEAQKSHRDSIFYHFLQDLSTLKYIK